jgi:four helix bundle protein
MASNYRQLIAWQRAMDLACDVFEKTAYFPREERFGLTSQMRRAANSVPSNIAEGDGRRGLAEQRRFFLIARGSLAELETEIEIAMRTRLLAPQAAAGLFEQITAAAKPLNGMITRIDRILPK